MAQRFSELSQGHIQFMAGQKIFFVGTATDTSRVSVSPKGMDSLVVLNERRVAWLNLTGSGNETAAHIRRNPRMTIMFCAFGGQPLILRLYGAARVIHHSDPEWGELISIFRPLPGARQIFDLAIDLVQSSCGFGVPNFNYIGERESLNDWANAKGEEGIRNYWAAKNQESIDGIPTGIVAKNVDYT